MVKIVAVIKDIKAELTKLSAANKAAKNKSASGVISDIKEDLENIEGAYKEMSDLSTIKNLDYASFIRSNVDACYKLLPIGYNKLWYSNQDSKNADKYRSEANRLRK